MTTVKRSVMRVIRNVWTGSVKKKLYASAAAIPAISAGPKPHSTAAASTAGRYSMSTGDVPHRGATASPNSVAAATIASAPA